MGLRDRFKKIKNRSGSSTPAGSQTPKINYYKPGEEPKPKYRGNISKEHTDKLHAFSFSDAWSQARRRSNISGTMSPGGTAQSRAASIVGSLKTGRKRSVASHSGSDTDGVRRKSTAVEPEAIPATVRENDDDDTNPMNAGGLSRPQTSGEKPPNHNGLSRAPTHPEPANAEPVNGNAAPLEKTATHDVPFSTEELEKAMTRATLEAPGSVARGGEIAAH